MQYRTDRIAGNNLSILGFGCMRFPSTAGRIDKRKTEDLLLHAYQEGINYYDTAYIYPGSEEIVGEIFEKHDIRKKVFIATKLPQTMCNKTEDFDKYFEIQKKRLRTDYIDYYFMHNISAFAQWEKLCTLGIKQWIEKKKKSGEIRNVGFSFHGTQSDFFLLLDAYEWDFVQIQYNYINTHYQAGTAGLQKAAEKGLPVFIMEPLLGGKLVNGLPNEALEIMKTTNATASPASWALNWLWNQPEVTVVLSGMSEKFQLEENIHLANTAKVNMFDEKEDQTIEKVISLFRKSYKVPCTGCNYCIPCPKNINIPACFTAYNTSYTIGWRTAEFQYLTLTGVLGHVPHFASDCIACGKCEKHCPQNIPIIKELKRVKRRLELPGTKLASKVVKKFMR